MPPMSTSFTTSAGHKPRGGRGGRSVEHGIGQPSLYVERISKAVLLVELKHASVCVCVSFGVKSVFPVFQLWSQKRLSSLLTQFFKRGGRRGLAKLCPTKLLANRPQKRKLITSVYLLFLWALVDLSRFVSTPEP